MRDEGGIWGEGARRAAAWALVFLLVASAAAASADTSDSAEPDRSNEIAFVVDGELRHTWSVAELMKGRFDWKSSGRHFHPAVPLVYLIDAPLSGVPRASIREVRIRGKDGGLTIQEADLDLLDGLLFKMNIGRSGTWDLVPRDDASERRLDALLGDQRIRRLYRVEILSHSRAGDGDPS